jgi:hypothetical protein
VDSFPDIIGDTPLKDCLRFWASRSSGIPDRRDIDPLAMPPRMLPHLFLYERLPAGFRCRLAGTAICACYGFDPTGRYLHEMIIPAALSDRHRLFNRCLDELRPIAYGGYATERGYGWVRFRRLLLPLRSKRGDVELVFGMLVHQRPDAIEQWNRTPDLAALTGEAAASPADLKAARRPPLPDCRKPSATAA